MCPLSKVVISLINYLYAEESLGRAARTGRAPQYCQYPLRMHQAPCGLHAESARYMRAAKRSAQRIWPVNCIATNSVTIAPRQRPIEEMTAADWGRHGSVSDSFRKQMLAHHHIAVWGGVADTEGTAFAGPSFVTCACPTRRLERETAVLRAPVQPERGALRVGAPRIWT